MGINRQARFPGSDWHSYGAVTFFEAAIQHCKDHAEDLRTYVVQIRCESQPELVSEIDVTAEVVWRVPNPRKIWMLWYGDRNLPEGLSPSTRVKVRLRDSEEREGRAECFSWKLASVRLQSDIVAYMNLDI